MSDPKITRYFEEQVLRKRPYLSVELCHSALADPIHTETQSDGRIRHWGEVTLPGGESRRILRVVTLADGETIRNAFLDRGFKRIDP